MAYLYRHIRLDTETPFYIGIGKPESLTYQRAYSKSNRSLHWHNVVNKVGYRVEIMLDNIPYNFVKIKEKEFIQMYGRIDLNNGILVNHTDGGEGNTNWSEERRLKQRLAQTGKFISQETRDKLSKAALGKKHSIDTINAMRERAKFMVITTETREKMAAKLRNRPQPQWQRDILSQAAKGKKVVWCYMPIYQFDLSGKLIKEYESISEASRDLGFHSANIGKSLDGNRKHCGGFLFERKDAPYEFILQRLSKKIEAEVKRCAVEVINIKTQVIYKSIKDASKSENITYNSLKWALSGEKSKYPYLRILNNMKTNKIDKLYTT